MHILNILQHSPEMCGFFPKKYQPIVAFVRMSASLPPGLQSDDD